MKDFDDIFHTSGRILKDYEIFDDDEDDEEFERFEEDEGE